MNENQPYEVRNVNEVEIPHEKELVADAILSVSANGGFHDIQAGAMSVWGIADQSNHLNEAEVPMPLGGNTGFVDGHVAWRPFEDMQIQHSAYMPYFWW
jgi:prepilin-type processing-associated H-X9-DG protein